MFFEYNIPNNLSGNLYKKQKSLNLDQMVKDINMISKSYKMSVIWIPNEIFNQYFN